MSWLNKQELASRSEGHPNHSHAGRFLATSGHCGRHRVDTDCVWQKPGLNWPKLNWAEAGRSRSNSCQRCSNSGQNGSAMATLARNRGRFEAELDLVRPKFARNRPSLTRFRPTFEPEGCDDELMALVTNLGSTLEMLTDSIPQNCVRQVGDSVSELRIRQRRSVAAKRSGGAAAAAQRSGAA